MRFTVRAAVEAAMGHVEGESRYQRRLLSPSLDEEIGAAHPVRVIDGFVDTLDLAELGFARVVAEATGRPPYRPGDLLKLYLWGYLNQLRSSRRLEREAERNLEVLWLIDRVSPSFKTIADFRRDHVGAIVGVCRAFVRFCREQRLYGGEVVALDGSKIEAAASRKRVITPKLAEKRLLAIDAKIAAWLAALDVADRAEAEDAAEDGAERPADVAAALAALRAQRERVMAEAKTLADRGLTQLVVGEEEARLMKTARHGHQVAYNAQTAVDARHGLIAAFELTSEGNDQRLLLPMALLAKEALGAETLSVVADTGYSNGEQGRACGEAKVVAAVPRPQTVNTTGAELFSRDAFTYDRESDSYTCPAGATLTVSRVSNTKHNRSYATNACAGCALKPRCTRADQRTIVRDFYEDDRQAMHDRADARAMAQRRELAEHPFAVLKWLMGHPRFLVRGLEKAKAELALLVLGFNLKRAIAIRGIPALLAALAAIPA